MKEFFRGIVASVLAFLSRAILRKYKPKIVMVTGSVGKTSTKDAVAAALSSRFHLRASEKSYNSEFGVPLTVIGVKNPWLNPLAWLSVFEEALALIFLPSHYPKLLVLEVGADRPGDLARILRIATPDAVVVTQLPDVPVHVEAYASPEAVREEEFAPAYALSPGAPLILCADDENAKRLASRLSVSVRTYGLAKDANVRFSNVGTYEEESGLAGMEAEAKADGNVFTLKASGVLGRQQIYAPAAALALALSMGLLLEEALQGLANYEPPAGRARILPGVNGSTLIDDTYNASPTATEEILRSLAMVKSKERVVVILGDMLELGRYSVEEHARVGKTAAETADLIVGVGLRARAMVEAAQEAGKRDALHFDDSREAAKALPDLVRKGDLVLIKGSQSIRMERITEALLRDSQDVSRLVRQEKEWKAKG